MVRALLPRWLPRWLVVAALLAALVLLADRGVIPLLAWTRRVFPVERLPLMFALYFAGYLAARRVSAQRRPQVLLALSLVLAAVFSVPFLLLSLAWLGLYHRVLYAPVWHGAKVLFVAATFAAWMLACHVPLAPRFHAAHPALLVWGYVFAAGFAFRIVWVLHQARMASAPPPLRDFLLYFLFAPFFLVLPYMFAIPRLDRFRDGLIERDPEVEASGVRMLASSLALGVALFAFTTYVWSPRHAFEAALRAGRLGEAALAGLAYYPGEVTAIAVSGSGILIGLVRILGIALAPSFDRPLAARSITEWWQRWNTHFRDVLVDLFWYPVMLRLRRRPYLSIWAGCGSVFLAGSVLLHWVAKPPFHHGSLTALPVGIACESAVMTVVVGLAMTRAQWRKRRGLAPRASSPLHVALARLGTYALVFATVVGAGYGATYVATVRPFEQLTPLLAEARELVVAGRLQEAAGKLAGQAQALRALADEEPLAPLRQSAAALALALPSPARDLSAAAAYLALARTYGDPLVPVHQLWFATAETLLKRESSHDATR